MGVCSWEPPPCVAEGGFKSHAVTVCTPRQQQRQQQQLQQVEQKADMGGIRKRVCPFRENSHGRRLAMCSRDVVAEEAGVGYSWAVCSTINNDGVSSAWQQVAQRGCASFMRMAAATNASHGKEHTWEIVRWNLVFPGKSRDEEITSDLVRVRD